MTTAVADYQVVPYEPAYREQVLDLQTHLWGANREANGAYLDWKYFRNPYATRAHIYLALHDGRVVGMRGMYGSAWETGGREPLPSVLCAGDLVFMPEHRGRGLFTTIMAHAEEDLAREGVAWLFNFSASVPTRLGSLSLGWRSVGPIATMRRDKAPKRKPGSVERFLHRVGLRAHQPTAHLFGEVDLRAGRRGDGITVTDASRPDAMAALVRRLGHDGRIRHVRDERYYGWRYGNPRAEYRFYFLGDSALDGYLALHIRRYLENPGPVRIVECEGTSTAVRAKLFAAAAADIEAAALEIWTGTRAPEDRRVLAELGFAEKEIVSAAKPFSTILVRRLGDRPWTFGGHDILTLASWDVRLLDSDAS